MTPKPTIAHWIPMTEALPEAGARVLLRVRGEVHAGWLTEDREIGWVYAKPYSGATHIMCFEDFLCGDATHWAPMPEAGERWVAQHRSEI